MATTSISSNERSLAAASAVLEVTATNPEYNQPTLRIKQAGKRGGAASIRIDDPNPDIEFVEIDQIAPAANMKLPFSRTSYRSMVATPVIVSSRLSSCFSDWQRGEYRLPHKEPVWRRPGRYRDRQCCCRPVGQSR
jgi:hypothetical protein